MCQERYGRYGGRPRERAAAGRLRQSPSATTRHARPKSSGGRTKQAPGNPPSWLAVGVLIPSRSSPTAVMLALWRETSGNAGHPLTSGVQHPVRHSLHNRQANPSSAGRLHCAIRPNTMIAHDQVRSSRRHAEPPALPWTDQPSHHRRDRHATAFETSSETASATPASSTTSPTRWRRTNLRAVGTDSGTAASEIVTSSPFTVTAPQPERFPDPPTEIQP